MVKDLFLRTLERPVDERLRFVRGQAGGDVALEREVISLLDQSHTALQRAESLLDTLAEPTPRWQLGDRIADRYVLDDRLGQGGMGTVFRARDTLLGGTIALKLLHGSATASGTESPHSARQLLEEARIARRPIHPNLCRVLEVGLHDDEPFLVLEWLEGGDLANELNRQGRLDRAAVRRLAGELASALAAIHGAGLLHRDIKPANILLAANGAASIGDFGIAEAAGSGPSTMLVGSPGYLAPEVMRGEPATPRSDLFALGVVLYEAATGRRAFPQGTAGPNSESAPPPPPVSTLVTLDDPVLERLIHSCCASDPNERPRSAEALEQVLAMEDPLEAILTAGERPSTEILAASRAPATLRPRGLALVGLALFVLFGLRLAVEPTVASMSAAGLVLSPDELTQRAQTLADSWLPARSTLASAAGFSAIEGERTPGVLYPWGLHRRGDEILFWYKESSFELLNWNALDLATRAGRLQLWSPYPAHEGSLTVALDPRGRLFFFQHTPPVEPFVDPSTEPGDPTADTDQWLRAALEAAELGETTLAETPCVTLWVAAGDERRCWRATVGEDRLRIDTATLNGIPTYFSVRASAAPGDADPRIAARQDQIFLVVYLLVPVFALTLLVPAWRHLRRGESDPWGAYRVAVFSFVSTFVSFLLLTEHAVTPAIEALHVLVGTLGPWLRALAVWVLYMGIEPWMQRYWPAAMVTWSRLVGSSSPSGRFGHPAVASHVLLGILAGLVFSLLDAAERWGIARLLGAELPLPRPLPDSLPTLRHGLGVLAGLPWEGLSHALLFASVLVVARRWIARPRPALLVAWAILGFDGIWASPVPWLSALTWSVGVVGGACWLTTRVGPLAFAVAWMTYRGLQVFPLGLEPSAWWFPFTVLACTAAGLVVIFALAAASRPWWSGSRSRAHDSPR